MHAHMIDTVHIDKERERERSRERKRERERGEKKTEEGNTCMSAEDLSLSGAARCHERA